jgi:hypothetical protein
LAYLLCAKSIKLVVVKNPASLLFVVPIVIGTASN